MNYQWCSDHLTGWGYFEEIAVDGMTGVGKSTLISKFKGRRIKKVNHLIPRVTKGSSYNNDIMKSMEYMFRQLVEPCDRPTVWDRSPFSNLTFYYVHHLMAHYRNNILEDRAPAWDVLNRLAIETNLVETVKLANSFKRMPILYIVDCDIGSVCERLSKRGGTNDMYNSYQFDYHRAQFHAFSYMSYVTKQPLLDLNSFAGRREPLSVLQAYVAWFTDAGSRVFSNQKERCAARSPFLSLHGDSGATRDLKKTIRNHGKWRFAPTERNFEAADRLQRLLTANNLKDDTMIYDYSCK